MKIEVFDVVEIIILLERTTGIFRNLHRLTWNKNKNDQQQNRKLFFVQEKKRDPNWFAFKQEKKRHGEIIKLSSRKKYEARLCHDVMVGGN